jgi:hypothetical protein
MGGRAGVGLAHLRSGLSLFPFLAIGDEHGEQHRHFLDGIHHSETLKTETLLPSTLSLMS